MGTVERWEFPWMDPVLSTEPMSESELVRRQGGWVFAGSIANSILGFAFWAAAAHIFKSEAVGIAGSLVSLSSLATSIGILGLDNGFVRFATRVNRPRRLMWEVILVAGSLSLVAGAVLSTAVLDLSKAAGSQVVALILLTVILTTSQTSYQIMDGALLAARKSEYLAYRAVSYGMVKIVVLFFLVSAEATGLFGAYTLPLLAVTLVSFFIVQRVWPVWNEKGATHQLRQLASLSGGNWISGIAYSLPSRLGPSLMLIFIGASPVSYFFIALQLAEVLNYIPESVSKSLFAHGSRVDYLPRSLTSSMRRLLAVIMAPMVALGVVLASLGMTIVGGTSYGTHGLALQLFLLATLPKVGVQLYKAQFNVDQRPGALVILGGTLGVATLGFFVIGLALGVDPDWLPLAWVLGGLAALFAGWLLSRGKIPAEPSSSSALD